MESDIEQAVGPDPMLHSSSHLSAVGIFSQQSSAPESQESSELNTLEP